MPTRKELILELAKVQAELWEMSLASYSQSNPAHVLGLRALKRRKQQLEEQLAQMTIAASAEEAKT